MDMERCLTFLTTELPTPGGILDKIGDDHLIALLKKNALELHKAHLLYPKILPTASEFPTRVLGHVLLNYSPSNAGNFKRMERVGDNKVQEVSSAEMIPPIIFDDRNEYKDRVPTYYDDKSGSHLVNDYSCESKTPSLSTILIIDRGKYPAEPSFSPTSRIQTHQPQGFYTPTSYKGRPPDSLIGASHKVFPTCRYTSLEQINYFIPPEPDLPQYYRLQSRDRVLNQFYPTARPDDLILLPTRFNSDRIHINRFPITGYANKSTSFNVRSHRIQPQVEDYYPNNIVKHGRYYLDSRDNPSAHSDGEYMNQPRYDASRRIYPLDHGHNQIYAELYSRNRNRSKETMDYDKQHFRETYAQNSGGTTPIHDAGLERRYYFLRRAILSENFVLDRPNIR
ncbi:unnamed protein product [Gordionus sp. m RMFG-2023]